MNKQLIAIATAAVLAVLGVVAVVAYANKADDRAMEGTQVVSVLRATQEVPIKTPVSELSGMVETTKVPKAAVLPGALTSLDDIAGQVSRTLLVPGDQLTTAKFAAADKVKGDTSVPKGMQELSIPLDSPRLVDGTLTAGDKVGVFTSYENEGRMTSNPINDLLVLKVSSGVEGDAASGQAVLTVAAKTKDAEMIVHAMEFGKIWLSKQNADTDTSGGSTINAKDVAP